MSGGARSALSGATALVTGGAAGIGAAVAEELHREGAAVVIADIDPVAGQEMAGRLGAEFVPTDMARPEQVQALFSTLRQKGLAIDLLVNNAGGAPHPHFPDAPAGHWLRSVALNLTGPMLATQLVIPMMVDRHGGAVVNVASVAGLGWGAHPAPEYAAAKVGLIRLTSSLVPLWGTSRIRVHCVCPDWVDTPSSRRERKGLSEHERRTLPPILDASEVAKEVVGLAKEVDSTGKVVLLRGGSRARSLPATHWTDL